MMAWQEPTDKAVLEALQYLEDRREPVEPRKRVETPVTVTTWQFITGLAIMALSAWAMIGAGYLCFRAIVWLWDVL